MLIEYVANKSKRNVSDAIGAQLVSRRIAREVVEDREIQADCASDDAEISDRTGKPKRTYKRRDMRAES